METITKESLLSEIKWMLDANRKAMINNKFGESSDYLDGANTALKELAVTMDLCQYEDLKD